MILPSDFNARTVELYYKATIQLACLFAAGDFSIFNIWLVAKYETLFLKCYVIFFNFEIFQEVSKDF